MGLTEKGKEMNVFVVVGCSSTGNVFAPRVFDSLQSVEECLKAEENAVLQKSKHPYYRFIGDNTYHVHACAVNDCR